MADGTGGEPKKIIIYKKASGHAHGHHGGAWKVAYADFVTAMMTFFLVMWLVSMQPDVKESVEGYFSNPVGFKKAFSSGENPLFEGNSPLNAQVSILTVRSKEEEERQLEETAGELREKLRASPELGSILGQIEVVVTDEGLRIELIEASSDETFFDLGQSSLRPVGRIALAIISPELSMLPNEVVLEGHTDARPLGGAVYSNWELSTDRAHAARRTLESFGLDPTRVVEVRGYAARKLRVAEDPMDATNRRVTILLPFMPRPATASDQRPGSISD